MEIFTFLTFVVLWALGLEFFPRFSCSTYHWKFSRMPSVKTVFEITNTFWITMFGCWGKTDAFWKPQNPKRIEDTQFKMDLKWKSLVFSARGPLRHSNSQMTSCVGGLGNMHRNKFEDKVTFMHKIKELTLILANSKCHGLVREVYLLWGKFVVFETS